MAKTIRELFEVYVYFRRQGSPLDFAIQKLQEMHPQASPAERQEIGRLIRQWESTEGVRHPANLESIILPLPTEDPPSAVLDHIVCFECHTENPPIARYCYACGTLLTRIETAKLVTAHHDNLNTRRLGNIILTVRGFDHKPIQLNLVDKPEVTIGRIVPGWMVVPDVDLTPYGAEGLGVSRTHATLKRKDYSVTITDMGSANHTFLNGERVLPEETRVVQEGSEIRLGRLVMRVAY